MASFLRLAYACAFGVCLTLTAQAKDVENPPLFTASEVLGTKASGPEYRVREKVGTDGYIRVYEIETRWGDFAVQGDSMLWVRLKEIEALKAMERTGNSKEFRDAMAKTAMQPVEFVGKLATDPKGTVKETVTGTGQMLKGIGSSIRNIGSGIRNIGKSDGDTGFSLLDTSTESRLIAYTYGFDPYTDFPPLKERLTELSRAAAAGGMVASGAFGLIPGDVGMIVNSVAGVGSLSEMVRDLSPSQLEDINRKALQNAGVSDALAEELLSNPQYTPTDITALAAALIEMGKLSNVDGLITQAAAAENRYAAHFMRKTLELMASHQRMTVDITGFATLKQAPFTLAVTRANGIEAIVPFDALSWTAKNREAFTSLTRAAKAEGFSGPLSLRITGTATPLAEKSLAALGWSVEQQIGR